MRRTAAAAGVLVAGCLFVLAAGAAKAPPAGAHALVLRSDPPDGAILQEAPRQVVVMFTEPPDPTLSFLHVLDQGGRNVETGKSSLAPGNPGGLRVALHASLPNGVYTIVWRTVSKLDGHVTGGSLSFGVGVTPAGAALPAGVTAGSSTPRPSPVAVIGRWALYWGLAILLGGSVFFLAVSPELMSGHRALVRGAWLLAVAGLVLMTVAENSAVGAGYRALFRSASGHDLIAQGVALFVVGVGVAQALARPRWTSFGPLAAAVGVALLVHAYAGHASGESPEWFNLAAQWIHMAAAAVWVGGLAWLLLFLRGRSTASRASAVARFSTMALWAVIALAATGVLRALDEVGLPSDWGRFLHTSFGLTVLVKIGLFLALVALGARNRFVNVPAIAGGAEGARAPGMVDETERIPSGGERESAPIRRRSLRRTVGAEVALAAAVLAATAVLSELPTSAQVAASRPRPTAPSNIVAVGSDFATTVRVRLTVTPGTVGPNAFQAKVIDYDTGRPVPATSVSLSFSLAGRPDLGSPTLPLRRGAGSLWSARGTVLSIDGRWSVTVLLQEATGAVTVPLQVQTRLPPEQISESTAPGQPTLFTIALPEGATLQSYVDPGRSGTNQVHFTFFTSSGDEQPIASASASETPPAGAAGPMRLIRFDAGHFVANASLAAGAWLFQVRATTPDGVVYTAYFRQRIAP